LVKLVQAAEALTRAIERLQSGSDAPDAVQIAGYQQKLSFLYSLQAAVSGAPLSQLASLAATVSASAAAASTTSAQSSGSPKSTELTTAQLAASSLAVRSEVQSLQSDLFGQHIFDAYLRFQSPADEREYREREAENRRYVEQQLAAKTPEGDLNAAGGTMRQMLDAHSHGAGASPEFQHRWKRLEETTRKQRDAMRADGRSTDEFDRDLATSVRRYLHDRGLSNAEIEAKLAVSASPLDAVKPYLKSEEDARQLTESANLDVRRAAAGDITIAKAVSTSMLPDANPTAPSMEDVMARFKAAGVVPAPATEGLDHGIGPQPKERLARPSFP
jgi:hypothetical protein